MDFKDERTEAEKRATTGFIVAFSDFGETHVIRPVKEDGEVDIIMAAMKERNDLKRVRYVAGKADKDGTLTYRPRLKAEQRAYIHTFNSFLPKAGVGGYVGEYVSYYPMRGKIVESNELTHGVTVVTTVKARGLLLNEWRVSEMLPVQLHQRDNDWRAWVIGEAMIEQTLRILGVVVTSELEKIICEITIPNTSEYYDEALRLWREIAEDKTEGKPSLAYINAKVLSCRDTEDAYMKALRGWHSYVLMKVDA